MEVKQYKNWRIRDCRPFQDVTVVAYTEDGVSSHIFMTINNDVFSKLSEEFLFNLIDDLELKLRSVQALP